MSYKVRTRFADHCGFAVNASDILHAATITNKILVDLPASLYKSVDFKTSSSIVGAVFCEHLAERLNVIVNPIEKGHPDILPIEATNASEAMLRNYGCGLEIKNTIGNITTGANLRAGRKRVASITGITWQAHHRDVRALMGLTWDFVQEHSAFNYPGITGVFYTNELEESDWGEISGTTGRNTKVSGMRVSGKSKMGRGWVLLWDDAVYIDMFKRFLPDIQLDE